MVSIKRYCVLIIVIALFILVLMPSIAYGEPSINAEAAILIDGINGQILWQKNAFTPLPPASTGKILTAITALDLLGGDTICQISSRADAVGESTIGLNSGEEWTLDDLLQGALIRSGNDACYAIGENIAGSEGLYVEWLNLKAHVLGAYQSTIKNTNGLPLEGHLMSAYDLSIFARYAMSNQRFREIVSTKYVTIGDDGHTRELKSTNKLLWQREDIIGIKTGTTDDAGACLVTASNKNGLLLIAVVLHSPNRYTESLELLDYGAVTYQNIEITGKDVLTGYLPVENGKKQILPFITTNDGYFLYPKSSEGLHLSWQLPDYVTAPVKKDQPVGKVLLEDNEGNLWGKIDLKAAIDIEKKSVGIFSIFN